MKKPQQEENSSYSITNDDLSPQKLLFERLSNKWFLVLLNDLISGQVRFNSLLKRHAGLSQKMLSKTLKNLEEDGLVTRTVNGNKIPVEVYYSITTFGLSLMHITSPLFSWSEENVDTLIKNRKRFNRKYHPADQ